MPPEDLALAVFYRAWKDCERPGKLEYCGRIAPDALMWLHLDEPIPGEVDDPYFKDFYYGPEEVMEWVDSEEFEFWCDILQIDVDRARERAHRHWKGGRNEG